MLQKILHEYYQTTNEARKNPSWYPSIKDDIASIMKNQMSEVTTLPFGNVPVSTRWIFKVKQKADKSL